MNKYLSIPLKQKSPYISLFKLIISLITGILLICFRTILKQTMIHDKTVNMLQLLYFFLLLTVFKGILPLIYFFKKKTVKGIRMMNLIIPAFLKSLLYVGLIVSTIFIRDILIFVFICLNTIALQIISMVINNCRKFNILPIIAEILILLAYFCNLEKRIEITDIKISLMVLIVGSVILLSYYYLHFKIFSFSQDQVDSVLSKQYPFELINLLIILILYTLASSKKDNYEINFSSLLNVPTHLFICVFMSILYEYLCYQFLKKINFKDLFLTQLTGLFWFNLFCFKQNNMAGLYASTFLSFFSLLLCTQIFQTCHSQKIKKITTFITSRLRQFERDQINEEN